MVLPRCTHVRATCVLLLLLCTTAVQATVYVRSDAPDGGNGNSWPTAFQRIQDGLNAANASTNNEVWIAQGTYQQNISMRTGIKLYGGFSGTENALADRRPDVYETIIDGGNAGNAVIGADQATIDGFTIRNGKGIGSGGGVYCSYVSPTVSDCRITGNAGNGVYCYQSTATIIDCQITNNTDKGIYCYIGGNPTITRCLISGNAAVDYAGIYCNSGKPTIRRCTISGNSATGASGRGGGIAFVSCSQPATVENCVITGNSAYNGGGIYCSAASPSFVNCTVAGNTAASIGGNAYLQTSNAVFRNTIFAFGGAQIGPIAYKNAAASPTFIYCGFWYPEAGSWFEPVGWNPTADAYAVCLDPLFVDRQNGDYHLLQSSPCIDAGTKLGAPTEDRDGAPRPGGALWDIGAYEMAPQAVTCDTVADAKKEADGILISLADAVVSGVFDGFFYVEQDDHSAGIRVAWPGSVPMDRHVTVVGTVETNVLERQINADSVSFGDSGLVTPRGMLTRYLAGDDLGDAMPYDQTGRSCPYGPNNVGLLVRVWGRVTPNGQASLFVTDGSDEGVLVTVPAGAEYPAADRFVQLTGICSVRPTADGAAPMILVRDSSDIVPLD